jgi:hypothetical protein
LFADTFAGAIERADFTGIAGLQSTLWKAYYAGHLTDDQAEGFAERLAARKGCRDPKNVPTSFSKSKATKPPERPADRQARIERRRRMAKAAPIPPAFVDKFTTGEAACIGVIAGEIARHGSCDLSLKEIGDIAGVRSKTTVRSAVRKARNAGLCFSQERRRAGQKSLTNVVRPISKPWVAFLRRWQGYKKVGSSTGKFTEHGSQPVDKSVPGPVERPPDG